MYVFYGVKVCTCNFMTFELAIKISLSARKRNDCRGLISEGSPYTHTHMHAQLKSGRIRK